MSHLPRTLGACLLLWLCGPCVSHADEPQLSARPGVLVMRTGRVVSGSIVRVGDRYVVGLGGQDQVRVSVDRVEMHCATLEEAYRRKRDSLPPGCGVEGHLALGDWCLRYELVAAAAHQLQAAQQMAPDDPRTVTFEKRLRLATNQPAARRSGQVAPQAQRTQTDLEDFIGTMPRGTVKQFTDKIQPLLLNRCGASSCHGSNSETSFRMISPSRSRVIPQRFTQRNLRSAIASVDQQRPRQSPLLVMSTIAHGGVDKPPLHALETQQLQLLADWVHRCARASVRVKPAVLNSPESILSQPGKRSANESAAYRDSRAGQGSTSPANARAADGAGNRAGVRPPVRSSDNRRQTGSVGGSDPFDPEIFNRRYLK